MIQRKQTIWLLLAAVCGFLAFKFPFYTRTAVLAGNENNILNASSTLLLTVIQAIIAVLALVVIFLFKKRILQLRLCILGLLLEALLIFLFYKETKNYIPGTYSLAALLQGATAFFYFIAARDINRDEKIVKQSDRLR